ncbi:MAG: TonB family protein, partial [Bacteroidales bacterium]|nr:TonB family protein [Bacteroidales bacterium]
MELKKSIKADLEWRKPLFFQVGIFIALVLILAMFELFGSKEREGMDFDYAGISMEDDIIIQTEQQKPEVAPPPPPPAVSTEIKIIEDNITVDIDYDYDAESDESTITQEYEYVEYVEEEVVEAEIFVVVEENPEFPGGEEARMQFFLDNIRYPKIAKEAGVEGRVIVSFVVEPDGRITNVKVERG